MRYSTEVTGMDCPSCARKIEHALDRIDAVESASVDVTTGRLVAEIREDEASEEVDEAVRSLGYEIKRRDATALSSGEGESEAGKRAIWKDRRLASVAVGAVLLVAALVTRHLVGAETVGIVLFVCSIVTGGFFVFRSALFSARALHLDISILMTVAVLGAMALGEWFEAATVVILFGFAEWLESASMTRARRAVRGLMELAPATARVRRDGEEETVPVEEVAIDETVIVRPGERIPVDGVVESGTSEVDQAPITGESKPVTKTSGDDVFAGTVNQRGSLEIRVDSAPEDTTLARVISAIEEARANRSESERFVETFAKYYTPAVIGLAAVLAVVPPLLFAASWETWIYRALVLLVIACPCALVIATPVTTVSGLTHAAKEGILVKGGRYLEELGRVKAVAFDKTGTLTRGKPEVTGVIAVDGVDENTVLEIAAIAEQRSEHYLARAILDESKKRDISVEGRRIETFEAHVGQGVEARVSSEVDDEQLLVVGNRELLREKGYDFDDCEERWGEAEDRGDSVVGVGRDGEFLGLIAMADRPRDGARETIERLRQRGIKDIYMLTGDNPRSAATIAAEIGVDEDHVLSRLMPAEKVAKIEELRRTHRHVVMVGDGVNDAPALAASPVGIAMGAAGTDIALETAHVALMADDLTRLPGAFDIGEGTVRLIMQNVALAIGIKVVILALVPFGYATLWLAILADMGASLIVIFNGMRA